MKASIREVIRRALAEDIGTGDVTTRALVPTGARATAEIVSRVPGVVCGQEIAREVFRQVDARVRYHALVRDGCRVADGTRVARIEGPARALLTGERTALNFLQQLGGIASLTACFVERAGPKVRVLDTRKTTPGLRELQKFAVRCGGGANHRIGLFDRVLIKDNHRSFWAGHSGATLADAVRAARRKYPKLVIEIEVDSPEELRDALEGQPDWVLLDNMPPARLRECVRINRGRACLEASGGITLSTIARIAATGVDAVSVGALTHSAPACDLSMEFMDHASRG
ncbi:MAG: carboxylating nicotinate-nucleotide diphosphorylase [Kiritimatiellae bacterium]|nr:carboxylating nicotinate-nucleotide diphosphorylase [Kiritimatiellia bacterium]